MRPTGWAWIAALAVLSLAAGYGVGHWFLRTPAPVASIGTATPTLPDLEGRNHKLEEWRGKLVVLNFWATWCPPCREEIPLLLDAQRQFAGQNVQIVGVAIDNPEAVAAYRDQMHIDYPILVGGDEGLTLMTRYGNSAGALPYSVFLSSDGRILRRKIGAFRKEELVKDLRDLLKHKAQ